LTIDVEYASFKEDGLFNDFHFLFPILSMAPAVETIPCAISPVSFSIKP